MSLQAEDVSVRFGGLAALDRVTLTIRPGTVTALVGPNGAGKSTLVNAITGHTRLSSGVIRVDGKDVTRTPSHRRAALGLSRTFQTPRVKPENHVFDNVVVGTYPRTRSSLVQTVLRTPAYLRNERAARDGAQAALERFELSSWADRLPAHLPVWTLRLVEVARAIAAQPKYILLDEPAAGIDSTYRNRLATLIRELAGEGLGVVMIEHNFELVRRVSDSVTVLDRGRVIAEGQADEVARDPQVAERYLGGAAHG